MGAVHVQRLDHDGRCAHHGERGRSCACLGLNNLRASILYPICQLSNLILAEVGLGLGLQLRCIRLSV